MTMAVAIGIAGGTMVLASETEGAGFTDFNESYTEYDRVMDLVDRGVIQGYGDGSFKPRESIYRRDTARMFQRALDLRSGNLQMPFGDVSPGAGFADAVIATYGAEIFLGSTTGNFGPDDRLTREQMASVIARAYGLQGTNDNVELSDLDQSSPTHREDIEVLYQNEVTTGRADGSFAPKADINRHEFAIMIARAESVVADRGPRMLGGAVTLDDGSQIEGYTRPYAENTITIDLSSYPGDMVLKGGVIEVTHDGDLHFTNKPAGLDIPDRQTVEQGVNNLALIDAISEENVTLNLLRNMSGSGNITAKGTFTDRKGTETPIRIIVKLK